MLTKRAEREALLDLLAARLRRLTAELAGRRRLGYLLEECRVVDRERLMDGLQLHQRLGVRLGEALVHLGHASEEDVARALARQAGLPFADLDAIGPEPQFARSLPEELARTAGILPLREEQGAVVVACIDPGSDTSLAHAKHRLGRPIRPVVVTPSALAHTLERIYREDYVRGAAGAMLAQSPENSAHQVLTPGQKRVFGGLLGLMALGFLWVPIGTAVLLCALATAVYVASSAYKLYLVQKALKHRLAVEITLEELAALNDRDLPVYSILVPVYRESEVLPMLVHSVEQLDYPKAKLDVRILLEEDDYETIEVARQANLPRHFSLVVVPHGQPKGKPKACNYGLIRATGAFVVIYDAEDVPDPDQLKKALATFRKGGQRLACVQAKLNYFNRDQNVLTRWFTSEYSMWFDLFLPGLDATGAPIPLGGTSNHFRVQVLRDLGAWDPYNVTEDADLGIRLYRNGWQTAVIDSTTYEEATAEVGNWIRQRSRWVKGYIQTWLVHMRHPVQLYRSIGFRAFLSFQLMIGGTFVILLLNPIFWLLTALWLAIRWELIQQIFPSVIFYLGALALYFGNFVFTYMTVVGCLQRRYHGLVKYALLSPLYWVLMSSAAWKGFLQLFYKPFYWEKTRHGLYKREGAPRVMEAA